MLSSRDLKLAAKYDKNQSFKASNKREYQTHLSTDYMLQILKEDQQSDACIVTAREMMPASVVYFTLTDKFMNSI